MCCTLVLPPRKEVIGKVLEEIILSMKRPQPREVDQFS